MSGANGLKAVINMSVTADQGAAVGSSTVLLEQSGCANTDNVGCNVGANEAGPRGKMLNWAGADSMYQFPKGDTFYFVKKKKKKMLGPQWRDKEMENDP